MYCTEKKFIMNDQGISCADEIMLEKCPASNPDSLLIQFDKIIISKAGFDLTLRRKSMTLGYEKHDNGHITHE